MGAGARPGCWNGAAGGRSLPPNPCLVSKAEDIRLAAGCLSCCGWGQACWGFFPLLLPLEGTNSLQTVLCGHWQRGQAEGELWDPQSFGLVSELAACTDTEFTLLHLHSVFAPRWCHDVGVAVAGSAVGQQRFAQCSCSARTQLRCRDRQWMCRQGTVTSPASVSRITSLADSDDATGDFPGCVGSLGHPDSVGTLPACVGPALGHPSCS